MPHKKKLRSCRIFICNEFIKNLPNKYETLIGENGIRLSGGEKKTFNCASNFKEKPYYFLDEATSSLDAETEDKIQKAINYLTKEEQQL